jgi:hypothetical protein
MPRRSLATPPAEESKSVSRRRAATEEYEKREATASNPARPSRNTGRGFVSDTRSSHNKEGVSRFQVGKDEKVIIKFLDPEPFVFFYQHWIDKKPYVCIMSEDEDCPLCDIKDPAKLTHLINVYNVEEEEVQLWSLTPDPASAVEARMVELKERKKRLDDPDIYFVVYKTQKKNKVWTYSVDIVKERDLEEDWDLEPVSPSAVDKALDELYTDALVKKKTRAELQEVVDDIED